MSRQDVEREALQQQNALDYIKRLRQAGEEVAAGHACNVYALCTGMPEVRVEQLTRP